MKVYGDMQSGNCLKVALVCKLLNIPHEWIHIDILAGETKQAEFLSKNPNGKIPLVELDDGRFLSESNAICNYLARNSDLIPTDPYDLACVQQWQFFEQYSHEPYIAVARFISHYLGMPEERREEFESKKEGGYKALGVMEERLIKNNYLVGESLTTADISLFAYTHVAHQGGFDLENYPGISAWIARIKEIPGAVWID